MIKIITGKKNSGKTHYLQTHLDDIGPCDGVLSIKLFDKKNFKGYGLRQIVTGQIKPFILYQDDGIRQEACYTTLGNFIFLKEGLEFGQKILQHAFKSGCHVVIDEIAQLELRGQGFYDSLTYGIALQNNQMSNMKEDVWDLYLVVREGLLDQVLDEFNIKYFQLIKIEGGEAVYDKNRT